MKNKVIYLRNYNKDLLLEELLQEVLERSMNPIDYYEVASILESFGWNDERVAETFGTGDVFELSMILWDMIKDRVAVHTFKENKKVGIIEIIKFSITSFLRGAMFALPMAISVFSMLTLRFSLWSYENLSLELATSIAIGTVLSFLSVGGFMQVIARRGFFYINQGFYKIAKKSTFYFVKLGYLFSIIFSLVYIGFNLFYENFPFRMYIVTLIYYFFLCANWLSVTVMYILKKEFAFTALISGGIGIVWFLFKVINLNIIYSQVIGLLFISITGYLLVMYFFNAAEKKMERGIDPPMPRKSIVLYLLKPYFIYGLMYFTFLFTDRIVSWSTNSANMPYIIWFRGDYELGLDFALLMLTVPMGFSELIVSRLMENLEITQKNSLHHEVKGVKYEYLKLYVKSIILIFTTSVLSAYAVYYAIFFMKTNFSALNYAQAMANSVTNFVFVIALISYAILCMALTNSVILFSLSQPKMVTRAIIRATIVNFFIGFLSTRWVSGYIVIKFPELLVSNNGYAYAVYGLLVGSIVFAIETTINVIKVMKNLDYYIYVAS